MNTNKSMKKQALWRSNTLFIITMLLGSLISNISVYASSGTSKSACPQFNLLNKEKTILSFSKLGIDCAICHLEQTGFPKPPKLNNKINQMAVLSEDDYQRIANYLEQV